MPLNIPLSNEFHQARAGKIKDSPGYLCPDPSSDLEIQGGYNSEQFKYIQVRVV